MPLPTQQKFDIVVQRNTFFFNNREFEEKWEGYVSSLTNLLLLLKRDLDTTRSIEEKKQVIIDTMVNKPDGISAVLVLFSISEEFFIRLVTFLCTINDADLSRLVSRESLVDIPVDRGYQKDSLYKLIRRRRELAVSLTNLFFEGFSIPILRKYIPLFELKKFNFSKVDFSTESLVDSVVRLSKRGSYKAQDTNDPAKLIQIILAKNHIEFKPNTRLAGIRRSMDVIIPNITHPSIIIESSYETTTSSAMGDKAKTEIEVAQEIRVHYPRARFIGFVDGVGWYVRRRDLERLVSAFDEVFTFQEPELERFLNYVQTALS